MTHDEYEKAHKIKVEIADLQKLKSFFSVRNDMLVRHGLRIPEPVAQSLCRLISDEIAIREATFGGPMKSKTITIKLTKAQSKQFIEALLNPRKPTARMKKAMATHKKLVVRRK